MAAKAYIKIISEKCKSCMLCVSSCSRGLIVKGNGDINALGYSPVQFNDAEGACKGCKLCAEMCPDCCIEIYKYKSDGEQAG